MIPSTAQVAALIPQRFHGEAPSALTVPTAAQISDLIEQRAVDVRNKCGDVDRAVGELDSDDGDALEDLARNTIALLVASYIESSFYPEQQGSDGASAVFLRIRAEEHVRLLRRQVRMVRYATRPQLEYPVDV